MVLPLVLEENIVVFVVVVVVVCVYVLPIISGTGIAMLIGINFGLTATTRSK